MFSKTIAANPKNYAAFSNRGVARQGTGDYAGSLVDFDQALRLKPDLPITYYCRGISWKFLGEFDRALDDQKKALTFSPAYPEALGEVAAIQFCRGEFASSIDFAALAIDASPGSPLPRSIRGYAQFALGCYKLAAADFHQAAVINADVTLMIYKYLACARAGQSPTDEMQILSPYASSSIWPAQLCNFFTAGISVSELLEAAPDTKQQAVAQYFIGQWHLLHGNTREAFVAFEAAARDCPLSYVEYVLAKVELSKLA